MKSCVILLLFFHGALLAQTSACAPILVFAASQNVFCFGTTITFHAAVKNPGTNEIFRWTRNGISVGVSTADYTSSDIHDQDVIGCEYTCRSQCGNDTTVTTPKLLMYVKGDVQPVLGIANNDPLICEGNLTVFTSQASYGNAVPAYQWLVNGMPVGATGSTYTTDSLTNGAEVKCILTTTTPGCTSTHTASAQMNIYVYPMIHPAIKITPSSTTVCRGEPVVFTATANGGTYPSFAWEINGIATGDVSSSLTTGMLKDGDSVSCTMTIDQDSRCHTTTSAPSNKVGMHVKDFKNPAIAIASGDLDICQGANISFTATGQNMGDYIYYQWLVNNKPLGNHVPDFSYNQFTNGDKVACILTTSVPGCAHNVSVASDTAAVTIRPAPVITFTPPQITILSGEQAPLNATVPGGGIASINWQPAAAVLAPQSLTTISIPLVHDTVFHLTVADTNGCLSDEKLPVKVLHKVYMPSAFTPNSDGKNDVFRITPGASLMLKQFSIFDRWGTVLFETADISKGWNGTYKGQPMHSGVYIYVITGVVNDKPVVLKGTVTLLR